MILDGRVSISGTTVTDPSRRIVPEKAAIAIDGSSRQKAALLTIALHKPRGYVTTRSDPQGRQTVYDLLGDVPARVVPVGRLDLATSGLLILTTDTQLANYLTDPKSAVPRVYLVTVEGRATDAVVRQLITGIQSDGERLTAAAAEVQKASGRESHLVVTLHEGKNRELRRMFDRVGLPVRRLRRVQFGELKLGTLAPGKWREISCEELKTAFPRYPSRRAPNPK